MVFVIQIAQWTIHIHLQEEVIATITIITKSVIKMDVILLEDQIQENPVNSPLNGMDKHIQDVQLIMKILLRDGALPKWIDMENMSQIKTNMDFAPVAVQSTMEEVDMVEVVEMVDMVDKIHAQVDKLASLLFNVAL